MSSEQANLDKAFAGGVAWTASAKWITQLVTWVSVLFSARLLTPQDFGAVELASFATILTNVLAEFGIGTTVLQMRELDRRTLAQLNSVSLIFSTAAFGLSCAFTPLVAAFFRTSNLIPLMLVNNLSYFITGFQSVPMGALERDMDFRRISVGESAQGIVQAITTVACAYAGLGYWSLLAGPMSGRLVLAALCIFWRPLPFALPRRSDVMAPMRFGFQVAVSRLAWAAYSQSDTIIIGRVLGASALGTYRLAISIATAPADKIVFLIMRVTGPLFAKVQKDKVLLKRYFLFISDALALVTFPLICGMIIVAPDAVAVALGPQWQAAVPAIKWLAAFTILRPLNTLASQILISLHFTSFLMWTTLLASVIMPASFFFAAPHGTDVVAMMWLAMSPLVLGPLVVKLFRQISTTLWEYLSVLMPPTLASVGMVLVVVAAKKWLIAEATRTLLSLCYQMVAGGAAYAVILWIFFRPSVTRYYRFFLRMRSSSAGLGEMTENLE